MQRTFNSGLWVTILIGACDKCLTPVCDLATIIDECEMHLILVCELQTPDECGLQLLLVTVKDIVSKGLCYNPHVKDIVSKGL